METELVGYRLIEDSNSDVVQVWSGPWGNPHPLPNPVVLPNGDAVFGWQPNTSRQGYTLEALILERELAQVQADYIKRLNDRAGQIRAKYLTIIPGQEMLYLQKRDEAVAALADPSPDSTKYPNIAASIGTEVPQTGTAKTDFDAAANLVMSVGDGWKALSGQIETIRLSGIAAIKAATDNAGVKAAYSAVSWGEL